MAFWRTLFKGATTDINVGEQVPLYYGKHDITVTEDTILALSTAYRCITVINNILGATPIKVLEVDSKGNEKEVRNYIYDLLQNRPNHIQTGQEFREALGLNLLLHGNAYARITRTARGKPTNLWILPSQDVTPIIKVGGDMVYKLDQTYLDNVSKVEEIPSTEILHIRLMGNGYTGLSPIEYGSNTFGIANSQEDFTKASFSSGGQPRGVIETDTILTDEHRKQLKDKVVPKISDSSGANIMLLENGLKWKATQLSQADMQTLSARKYQVEDIARWFGVPLALLGIGEHAGDRANNVEQAIRGWLMTDLGALLERFQNAFTIKLLSPNDRKRYKVVFDTNKLIRHDIQTLGTIANQSVTTGIITQNEGREMLNLPVLEGDEYNQLRQQKQMVNSNNSPADDTEDSNAEEENTE